MTTDNDLFLTKLKRWSELKEKIAEVCTPLVTEEMELRKEIFSMAFPSPKEGTNNSELQGKWILKGTYKLDRKIDEAALPAVLEQLRKQNVVTELLVKYEPKLSATNYKALSIENQRIFDQAMTIKPASPTLELIPPKTKGSKA